MIRLRQVAFVEPGPAGRHGITHLDLATPDEASVGSTSELLGVEVRFVAPP